MRKPFYFLSFIIFIMSGCGALPKYNILDIQVGREQLNLFLYEASLRNKTMNVKDLIIKYDDFEDPIIGSCSYDFNLTPIIKLDRSFWNQATLVEKELLMLHESGHCLLNREHTPGDYYIMSEHMINSNYYLANRTNLIDELFQKEYPYAKEKR